MYNISRHQSAAFLNQCRTSPEPSVTNRRRKKNNDGHKHKVTTGLSGNKRSPLAVKVNYSWNRLLCRTDVDTCKGSDLNENSNTSINGGEKLGFPRLSVLLQAVCSLPRCRSSCHGNKLCRDGFRFWQWLEYAECAFCAASYLLTLSFTLKHNSLQSHFTQTCARTHAHRFRQSRWQSVGAWSWSILSWECMNLITAFLQRINKWAWPEGMKRRRRRRRHDLIIPNQKSGQIMSGRWKGLFPPGWGGVGFKHQAPAAAHDSADIVA